MLFFPNAKINIGLQVTQKRTDGYHNIETIFYPTSLCDVLEITPSENFQFQCMGTEALDGENICEKAYHLLAQNYPIPAVHIHLLKNIPIGAGLGGGSADAAFTLIALNELFKLDISKDKLQDYARILGADCAFFIANKPQYAYEKGDIFEDINLDLSAYDLILAMPNISISTAEAYSGIQPTSKAYHLPEWVSMPIETWKNTIKNDFETSIFQKYPVVKELKNYFYLQGAHYAAMSGSGAAVFGIFPKNTQLQNLPKDTQIFYPKP